MSFPTPFPRVFPAAAAVLFASTCLVTPPAMADNPVARGRYLVTIAGCGDCHTPGSFTPNRDESRYLGGSRVGFEVAGLGIFYAPNLTPDKATGLGGWTDQQIIDALTKGIRPDGRELVTVMPWKAFASLTADDRKAIVAFLRSLPAVGNAVPGPVGAGDKAKTPFLRVISP